MRKSLEAASDAPPSSGRDVLSDLAYAYLEAEILSGRWRPHTKVSLRALAELLEMSIQPVRDAVSRLVALSALETTPGRSVWVPRVDRDTADELWSMRLLLEAEIASLAASRRTPEQLDALFDITDKMARLDWHGNADQNIDQTLTWARLLIQAANAPMLSETVLRMQLRYAPFLADCLNVGAPPTEEFLKYTNYQQRELVQAIERQDSISARHLRCADIRTYQRYIYSCQGWHL